MKQLDGTHRIVGIDWVDWTKRKEFARIRRVQESAGARKVYP